MFRRKPKPLPPAPPLMVTAYFRGTAGGRITTTGGRYVCYAYSDMWIKVEIVDGTKLLGPIEGPYTLDEANALELARQQAEWDRSRDQRKDAWDSADYRARTILGSWANDVHADAIAELRKLIFQAEYGFSNEDPGMHPRPVEVQMTFGGTDDVS